MINKVIYGAMLAATLASSAFATSQQEYEAKLWDLGDGSTQYAAMQNWKVQQTLAKVMYAFDNNGEGGMWLAKNIASSLTASCDVDNGNAYNYHTQQCMFDGLNAYNVNRGLGISDLYSLHY